MLNFMVLKYNGLSLLKMTVFVNVGRKQMIIWVEQLQQLTVLHVLFGHACAHVFPFAKSGCFVF